MLDLQGNLYVVGSTSDFAKEANALVLKLSSDGDIVWSKSLNISLQDVAYGVSLSSDNSIYVVGTTMIGGRSAAFVVKLSQEGEVLWSKVFFFAGSGVGPMPTNAYAVGTDANGQAYVVGGTRSMG